MRFIDIFGLILSLLGLYSIVYSLRLLLPRNIVPLVSTSHNEAMALLENAEAINIPNTSGYRVDLAIFYNQFLQMRTESHRSPGVFQQLRQLSLCGLTYRLYDLKSQIEAVKRKIELAVDERQLASVTNAQGATTTALPASAADTVIHAINIVEPARPPQVSLSTPNAS